MKETKLESGARNGSLCGDLTRYVGSESKVVKINQRVNIDIRLSAEEVTRTVTSPTSVTSTL